MSATEALDQQKREENELEHQKKALSPPSLESSPTRDSLSAAVAANNNGEEPASPTSSTISSKSAKEHQHQFDTRLMNAFYEACSTKYQKDDETLRGIELNKKEEIYRKFKDYLKKDAENEDNVKVLVNVDLKDVLQFNSYLESLKHDGLNSIEKYKKYVEQEYERHHGSSSSSDHQHQQHYDYHMDMVIFHLKYGLILVKIKENDYLNQKQLIKTKQQIQHVQMCLMNLMKLIDNSSTPQITNTIASQSSLIELKQVVVLPNVLEKPPAPYSNTITTQLPSTSSSKPSYHQQQQQQQLNYLIKSDLNDFDKWWNDTIVTSKPPPSPPQAPIEDPSSSSSSSSVNHKKSLFRNLLSLITCIRKNSIIPVVDHHHHHHPRRTEDVKENKDGEDSSTTKSDDKKDSMASAAAAAQSGNKLSVCAKFFNENHEKLRTLSKVCLISKNEEKLKESLCLQLLWFSLNDPQKKLSIICKNKEYYEEYLDKQRKLYATSCTKNIRFYTDMHSCPPSQPQQPHTISNDNDIWLFECLDDNFISINDLFERCKEFKSYWIFKKVEDKETETELKKLSDLNNLNNLNYGNLDNDVVSITRDNCLDDEKAKLALKLPLRLHSDLLIISDLINPLHNQQHQKIINEYEQYIIPKISKLNKKVKTIKFLYASQQLSSNTTTTTIDYLKSIIKMHDSIQAKFILIHVGEDDLNKLLRNQSSSSSSSSIATKLMDSIKELIQLIREYCPKSFIILSSLIQPPPSVQTQSTTTTNTNTMTNTQRQYHQQQQQSTTASQLINDVNKLIINYCKQTMKFKQINYMNNQQLQSSDYYFNRDQKLLTNSALRYYFDQILQRLKHHYDQQYQHQHQHHSATSPKRPTSATRKKSSSSSSTTKPKQEGVIVDQQKASSPSLADTPTPAIPVTVATD